MNPPRKSRTGRITGSFLQRDGEVVWVVAWDDKGREPPFKVEAAPDLEVGAGVRLEDKRLVRR